MNRDIWGALEEIIFACDRFSLLVMDSEGYIIYANETINQIFNGDVFKKIQLPVHYSDICSEGFDHLAKIAENKDLGKIGRLDISKKLNCVYFSFGKEGEEQVIICLYFKKNAPETKKSFFYRIIEHKGISIEQILECLYDGIYISDENSKTLLANTAFEHITGINKIEFLGKDVRELVKKGYFDTSVSEEVRKKKKRITISQKYKTGKEVLATGNPIFDSKGDVAMVVTNIRDMTDLIEINKRLEDSNRITAEYRDKINKLQLESTNIGRIIAQSDPMQFVFNMAKRISNTDATVLIYGETGVGKDLVANFIHEQSGRSNNGIMEKINCGGIPENLLESELFGYEGGAFTGAKKEGKIGLLELADKGTIFLDEINSLPMKMQSKLLHFLQDFTIQRVGGTKSKKIDIRLICASNQDLKTLIENKTFRSDLYYRLNVVPIKIPSLKERRDDILPLCKEYMRIFNKKYDRQIMLSNDALKLLKNYDWPGNVRELANLMERLVVTSNTNVIHSHDLPIDVIESLDVLTTEEPFNLKNYLASMEISLLNKAIMKYGSAKKAAPFLGVDASTITRKIKR